MRQFTALEASFLYADRAHANANVSFLQVYDQSTAPGGRVRFKSILALIESRLHRAPLLRSRLLPVPFQIDHPYWVEDEHFDLEYHVRHIALPKPGDWRQFCIQASRIHARALDLNRPLWEIYVIEGLDSLDDLPSGSFALLTKIHHAAIDLENRNQIVELLHDPTPGPVAAAPPVPWLPQRVPGALALGGRSLLNSARSPLKLLRPLARLLPAARAFAGDLLRLAHDPAATRFNAVVSPHRVFESRRFDLVELEAIRACVAGASLNDVLLALCAGGLRRYLSLHEELPEAPLWACVQAGARDAAVEAAATPLHVDLGTHLDDPLQRLRWIHQQGARSRRQGPQAARRSEPLTVCTLNAVRSPQGPLYLNGARLNYFSAILPIADGTGLVFAVTQCEGRVVLSPTSCRELMPDPEVFAVCLRESYQELLALAGGREAAAAGAGPSKSPRRERPRASASDKRSPQRPRARSAATAPRPAPGGRRRSTEPRR